MAVLLYQNKIDKMGPARSGSFRTERFQVDSYTIRGVAGINAEDVKYSVSWVNLTQAEAAALTAQFQATNGISLLQWTPPLEAAELNLTVLDYNVTLHTTQVPYTYKVTANLMKEYDLT